MNLQNLVQVEQLVRAKFTYAHDPVGTDRWKSYHKEVLAGLPFQDDCDSLTSTVINVLHAVHNLPLERAWFCHVDSSHDGVIDHMIGAVQLDDNSLWIAGDTFGPAYPAVNCKHNLVKFCKVSNILAWYEGRFFSQLLRI